MKKVLIVSAVVLLAACNNSGNDTVNTADSINAANRDTAMNGNANVVLDEASSTFLTSAANSGMAEVEIAGMARQKAANQPVKDFASMIYNDHSGVNAQVKSLASQKNIVLPDSMSADKRELVSDLEKRSGKNFDKDFLDAMVSSHEKSIDMFEKAMNDAKDADVRAFADKTLPALRKHLDSAKALRSKY
jgi:putative membrane protein